MRRFRPEAVVASLWAILALPSGGAQAQPSLEGAWSTASLTELERPKELTGLTPPDAEVRAFESARRGQPQVREADGVGGPQSEWWETDVGLARIGGQARSSWIVSPADGQRPFTPEAKAVRKQREAARKAGGDGPEVRATAERCLPDNSPHLINGGYNDNLMILQTADTVLIWIEWMNDLRVVRLGDRTHRPPQMRQWLGDSVGWWEGKTLVVETTNFTATEVGAPAGDMKVVERFTRSRKDEILYAFSVTNPALYTETWRAEMVLRPANGRLFEFACHEGNYSLPGILAAGRAEEAAVRSAAEAAR